MGAQTKKCIKCYVILWICIQAHLMTEQDQRENNYIKGYGEYPTAEQRYKVLTGKITRMHAEEMHIVGNGSKRKKRRDPKSGDNVCFLY